MRPQVARIVRITNPDAREAKVLGRLGDHAAPMGMHYVYDGHTQAMIPHAFLYIYWLFGPDGRIEEPDGPDPSRVPWATNRSKAYELAEWLRFLVFTKRRWDRADHELICVYAHYLSTNVSAHSGKRRKRPTISHKLSTVYGFYNFANAALGTDVRWDRKAVKARYRAASKERRLSDDQIRPFSEDEVVRMRERLGALPSERAKRDRRPSRDRLLLETGLGSGMRGEEIVYLSSRAIKALKADMSAPDATQPLRIRVTKGKEKRYVALPNSLIHELQVYIAGERSRAVGELIARGGRDHGRVFVNMDGTRTAGEAISTNTIHRRFVRVMVKLGCTRKGTRLVDGIKEPCLEALHSFHDARHFYAVNLYCSLRDDNEKSPFNPPHKEPWRIVQVMLGHEDWEVTRKYYLRWVGGEWEAKASEATHDYLEDA